MRMKVLFAALAVGGLALASPALARGGSSGGHGGGHSSSHSSGRSSVSSGEHYTVGHTTKTGSYVKGHYSTNPDGTRNDNYSTRGNINPHTGEAGTKPRDGEPY